MKKRVVKTAAPVQGISTAAPAGVLRSGRKSTYLLTYTLVFCVMAGFIFLPFALSGKSFVNGTDAMTQYIVYLRYMGQYLRSALAHIFSGNFSIPEYDFSIGMGDEIGQIVRFHPLDFLSVLVPSQYTEQLYAVILFIRLYLAGLSFSAFAFYLGSKMNAGSVSVQKDRQVSHISAINVLSGAMIYVYGGYMLIRCVNHPTYAAPFIVFPLLLIGAERVMRHEGNLLFPAMVFLGFWSNYYFMYIMSIGLFLYVMVRFFDLYPKDRIRSFFGLAARMIMLYLLGMFMAFATLLPTVYRYGASVRSSVAVGNNSLFIYSDKRRYFAWFLNLISPYQSSGNGLNLNYPVIVLPCLAILFSLSRRTYRALKWFLFLCVLAILIPAIGYVLAVFNRENSRWVFLAAMCLGMCTVLTADRLQNMTQKAWLCILSVTGLYLAAVLIQIAVSGENRYIMIGAAELIVCDIVLYCIRKKELKKVQLTVLLITCVSGAVNGFITYVPSMGGEVLAYMNAGNTTQQFENDWRSKAALEIEDPSFYRVEADNVSHRMDNAAEYSDFNGLSEYNSILNASMMEALGLINNKDYEALTTIHGLNARPISMNLAHARYYVTNKKNPYGVPYGYTEIPSDAGEKIHIFRCENPLSFGFSYDTFITRENYEALKPLEREMVQLYACVAEDEDQIMAMRQAGLQEMTSFSSGILDESIEPVQWDGAEYAEGKVQVTEANQGFLLEVHQKAGYDCYLCLEGLVPDSQKSSLTVRTGGQKSSVILRNKKELYNTGREDYLVHLSYSDIDEAHLYQVIFDAKGTYRLTGMRIYYVPMDGFDEAIDRLNEESLDQEMITDGRAEGTITLSSPKLVVFSIPSAKGWELYVDGERADLQTADIMYLSSVLQAGTHEIQLIYKTPGARMGMGIALTACAVWLLLALWQHRTKKRFRS